VVHAPDGGEPACVTLLLDLAVDLPAVVECQQAGQALISFAYVWKRSARSTEDG